jgi:transcriptional regulator with XRE-family HTH domain
MVGEPAAPRDLGENFGEFMQAMRFLSNQSQRQIAEPLGVSQKTISHWEHGILPNRRFHDGINELFELEPSELNGLIARSPGVPKKATGFTDFMGGIVYLSSWSEVADALGVDTRTVNAWVLGRQAPNPEAQMQINQFFKLGIGVLDALLDDFVKLPAPRERLLGAFITRIVNSGPPLSPDELELAEKLAMEDF